jgi:dipeptidyl aminopeptidase/acylaminoacyl peptidase
MMHRTSRILALLVVIVIFGRSRWSLADGSQPFTVKDSIEMTTFSDPYTRLADAECKRSPDGKYFLVVTTRGVLRTNQVVSTLWIYQAAEVEGYLHVQTALPPKPQLLFRIAGMLVAHQNNSYGSLITKAQWSSDSKSVLSLVERPGGSRHLLRSSLSGKRPIDLTPGVVDITDFGEADGTIAYLVAEHKPPGKVIGQPIDEGSSDLTGLSLFHILFQRTFPDPTSFWPAIDLWVRYRGVNRQVTAGGKWHFPASAAGLRLAVSPNGRGLIAARPVSSISTEWLKYKTASNTPVFAPASTGTDRSGKGFNWPWQYVYVDLDKMMVTPVVDAPSGVVAGYVDDLQATWAPDSQTVLFTNSYLPLRRPPEAQSTKVTSACAAAVYTVVTGQVSCVAYARFPEENQSLSSAIFGASSSEVVLHWSGEGSAQTQVYAKIQQGWELGPGKATTDQTQAKLIIFIRQDLDEVPALWAAEMKTGLTKRLWDPNPQLVSLQLGQASFYTWKDSTGYEWHAGLIKPPDFVLGHRYPLVIQTHGFYNEHEFLVDGSFTTGFAARPLAASGIVVLQMAVRADRHIRPAQEEALLEVQGFESAIDHLDRDGLIDPDRVGIIGFSRTAWYVEETLIHAPHRFRAATLIDGTDQSYLTYMLFAPGYPEAIVEQEAANGGKPFGTGLNLWVKNAASFNLDQVQTPVRIETIGPISILGEWEIYSSLYQQGKPVDLIYIPVGQHILQNPKDRYASQQGNVDWFRFFLQGYKDPDPARAKQYTRWEQWTLSNGRLTRPPGE